MNRQTRKILHKFLMAIMLSFVSKATENNAFALQRETQFVISEYNGNETTVIRNKKPISALMSSKFSDAITSSFSVLNNGWEYGYPELDEDTSNEEYNEEYCDANFQKENMYIEPEEPKGACYEAIMDVIHTNIPRIIDLPYDVQNYISLELTKRLCFSYARLGHLDKYKEEIQGYLNEYNENNPYIAKAINLLASSYDTVSYVSCYSSFYPRFQRLTDNLLDATNDSEDIYQKIEKFLTRIEGRLLNCIPQKNNLPALAQK